MFEKIVSRKKLFFPLVIIKIVPTVPRPQNHQVPVLHLTSSSDLMVLSCSISWKRSKLFVPMGCSSNSLHRATSWGRSRCSSVSSSSNSFENRTMSFVVGCSPVPRTWEEQRETRLSKYFPIQDQQFQTCNYLLGPSKRCSAPLPLTNAVFLNHRTSSTFLRFPFMISTMVQFVYLHFLSLFKRLAANSLTFINSKVQRKQYSINTFYWCNLPSERMWRSAASHLLSELLLYSFEPSQRWSPGETWPVPA